MRPTKPCVVCLQPLSLYWAELLWRSGAYSYLSIFPHYLPLSRSAVPSSSLLQTSHVVGKFAIIICTLAHTTAPFYQGQCLPYALYAGLSTQCRVGS